MTIYPGIDVSYRLGDQVKLFASYNSSLRLPSFTEMYYKLKGYAADPHLKPEEMQAIELGTQYQSATLQAKLSAYHHHGKNMIDWIMDTSQGEEARWQSINHTKINSYGIEASATTNLQQLLPSQQTLKTLSVSYSYIHQDKDMERNIVSQYALEYLKHKLVASLDLHIWSKLNSTLHFRWQDRVGTYTDFQNQVNDYRPFALVDARLCWKEDRKYMFYAEANNLLNNKDYVDYGNVPQPGAWIVVGACWQLDF